MNTKYWEQKASALLIGRTITKVRYMTEDEAKELGWFNRALVIEFDNNAYLVAQGDDEGNDAGALYHGSYTDTAPETVLPTLSLRFS
jgi:hypothetical protein